MNELNREQIIKDLECCKSEGHVCYKCSHRDVRIGISCRDALSRDALSLINELTEVNERLRAEVENQSILWKQHFESIYETAKETLKADTVRKMVEKITEHATNGYPRKVRLDVIDQIAKEMEEGRE